MEASKRIILFKKPPKEILVSVILQKNGGCTHVYIFTAANVCICKWYSSFWTKKSCNTTMHTVVSQFLLPKAWLWQQRHLEQKK